MRIVFVGAGKLALTTARRLLEHKNEVVIVEISKQRIEEISCELDCGFLHGDGSRPAVLREADPENTDILICLTGSDQTNIISSLVGRSLGFKRIVTKIEDQELDHICQELALDNTIIPTRTISRFLTDMVEGKDILEMSTMIKGEARFFSFVVSEAEEGSVKDLGLPAKARVICYYRDGKFIFASDEINLKKDDEVIIFTHRDNLAELRERWLPKIENKAAPPETPAAE